MILSQTKKGNKNKTKTDDFFIMGHMYPFKKKMEFKEEKGVER